jgi:lipoprotein-releasing system ATP-binding protein
LLQVSQLTKTYPTVRGALPILTDVSFSLSRGDAASIMGPSGSGKSTLLYIVGALEPPTRGRVTLDGTDPFALDEQKQAAFRNSQVGFVFQDHLLLPQCTVLENVLVPTLVSAPDATVTERARVLLEQVGLRDRMDHRPAELSGGERQRVALARALIRQPPLVVCDEPTGNLDRGSAETITALLFELHQQQNSVLLIVTHNPELATRCPIRYRLDNQQLTLASGQR